MKFYKILKLRKNFILSLGLVLSMSGFAQEKITLANIDTEEVVIYPEENRIKYKLLAVTGAFQCYSYYDGKYHNDSLGRFILGKDESIYVRIEKKQKINDDSLHLKFYDKDTQFPYSYNEVKLFFPQIDKEQLFETDINGEIHLGKMSDGADSLMIAGNLNGLCINFDFKFNLKYGAKYTVIALKQLNNGLKSNSEKQVFTPNSEKQLFMPNRDYFMLKKKDVKYFFFDSYSMEWKKFYAL